MPTEATPRFTRKQLLVMVVLVVGTWYLLSLCFTVFCYCNITGENVAPTIKYVDLQAGMQCNRHAKPPVALAAPAEPLPRRRPGFARCSPARSVPSHLYSPPRHDGRTKASGRATCEGGMCKDSVSVEGRGAPCQFSQRCSSVASRSLNCILKWRLGSTRRTDVAARRCRQDAMDSTFM